MKLRTRTEEKRISQETVGRPMDTARILQKGAEKWLTALEGRDETMASIEVLTYGRMLILLEMSSS